MAWTSPRTWVSGEVVTHSLLNTHVRDNLNYLKGAAGTVDIDAAIRIADSGGNFLEVPTLTTTQRNALTASNGMIIYNSTTAQMEARSNGAWVSLGGVSQATAAAIEAETNEDTYVPPDLVRRSPGVAKAWCQISSGGSLSSPSHNVSSVTDTGTGDRTVNFNTAFSSAVYAAVAELNHGADNSTTGCGFGNFAAGSVRLMTFNASALQDLASGQAFFGDQ